ncbi:MAG: hypothetical protein NTY04_03240 [Candidatus Staskawiczbacteria bacterium]|nr:hypothetical protein [Candidatus Staskawiczbacteria bacterium]
MSKYSNRINICCNIARVGVILSFFIIFFGLVKGIWGIPTIWTDFFVGLGIFVASLALAVAVALVNSSAFCKKKMGAEDNAKVIINNTFVRIFASTVFFVFLAVGFIGFAILDDHILSATKTVTNFGFIVGWIGAIPGFCLRVLILDNWLEY